MNNLVSAGHFDAAMIAIEAVNAIAGKVIDTDGLPKSEKARIAQEARTAITALDHHKRAVAEAQRPATNAEIGVHLAMLLKAFPNAGRDDVVTFGDLLLSDVCDQRPSISALVAGCTMLRRTSRFLPAISEVLEAIGEVDTRYRVAAARMEWLPQMVAGLEHQIDRSKRPAQG